MGMRCTDPQNRHCPLIFDHSQTFWIGNILQHISSLNTTFGYQDTLSKAILMYSKNTNVWFMHFNKLEFIGHIRIYLWVSLRHVQPLCPPVSKADLSAKTIRNGYMIMPPTTV